MTTLDTIIVGLIAWAVLSVLFGLFVGYMINKRNIK